MFSFILPDVGEGLHEAELVEWTVQVGDAVAEGDVVAVVNTEKVTVDLPSPVEGVVVELLWSPGDSLNVGDALMRFEVTESAATEPGLTAAAAPPPGVPEAVIQTHAPEGPSHLVASTDQPIASPTTRKLAVELGVDLSIVSGSGPGGRILRDDIEAQARSSASASSTSSAVTKPGPEDEVTREPLTGVRAVVWRHMTESSTVLATTTSTFTVRMEAIETLLREFDASEEKPKVGVLGATSLCVVRALTRHTRFNATVDPETNELLVHSGVHLGVAVAAPAGLVVPVIQHAESLRVDELNSAIHELAGRARRSELDLAELRGGTFTISSTGGSERARVTSTQPIVNLPQVALLWMSRIRDEPVVHQGAITAGRVMSCSLSFDHRYLDGADATNFINEITDLMEHPLHEH